MSTPDQRPMRRSLAKAIRSFSDEDVLFERLRVSGPVTAGQLAEARSPKGVDSIRGGMNPGGLHRDTGSMPSNALWVSLCGIGGNGSLVRAPSPQCTYARAAGGQPDARQEAADVCRDP